MKDEWNYWGSFLGYPNGVASLGVRHPKKTNNVKSPRYTDKREDFSLDFETSLYVHFAETRSRYYENKINR